VASFDTLELIGPRAARLTHAGERQAVVVELDSNGLLAHTGQLRGHHVTVVGLVQVHGGRPVRRRRGPSMQALLDGEQIAKGIPPCERHDGIVPCLGMVAAQAAPYATIPRFY